MLSQGTRRFDLYDFFSIFIPGAATLIALVPFAPKNSTIPLTGIIGAIIIGGIVVGRGIHATALWLEQKAGAANHRNLFISQLKDPTCVSPNLANQFYQACYEVFDTEGLPSERSKLKKSHDAQLENFYTLVRSYVHIDGRGRSRTFQAVLDFYRSIWVASFGIAFIYGIYALWVALGAAMSEMVGYQSYLSSLQIHYSLIFWGVVFVVGGAYGTFERVRSDYREYFVQYLFSDFVVLQSDGINSSGAPPAPQGPASSGQSGGGNTENPKE